MGLLYRGVLISPAARPAAPTAGREASTCVKSQALLSMTGGPAGLRDTPAGALSSTRLAAEAGLRQFLDIGTGIPAAGNTHEVAQRVAPDARVVYVDNDPLVLLHAQALLRGTRRG